MATVAVRGAVATVAPGAHVPSGLLLAAVTWESTHKDHGWAGALAGQDEKRWRLKPRKRYDLDVDDACEAHAVRGTTCVYRQHADA